MAARIGNITVDCDDVLKMAAFWSSVLGRPLDKGSSTLPASIGGTDGARQQPAWYFNKVPAVMGQSDEILSCNRMMVTTSPHGVNRKYAQQSSFAYNLK